MTRATLLMCDLLPYWISTRTRKVGADTAARAPGRVTAVTLAAAGRYGVRDRPGVSVVDGVEVEQVPIRPLSQRRSFGASLYNLVCCYGPAVWRLRRTVLATPADTIFVGQMPLLWIGLAHRRRWGSQMILNGREWPGRVRTRGSLASWFSRVEPHLLRLLSRRHALTVIAATEGLARQFQAYGVQEAMTVRNFPNRAYAPTFVPPPPGPELVVACVGNLYPGRGPECLIDAVVTARAAGVPVRLTIVCGASDDYRRSLRQRVDAAAAGSYIHLGGPCRPEEVAGIYHGAHLGTALFETGDPANDGLSNKLFESIVAGRPVIAGDLDANRDLVGRYGVGWTSPVRADALADLLTLLARDLSAVRAKAEHCFEVGHREFVWEQESRGVQERIASYRAPVPVR